MTAAAQSENQDANPELPIRAAGKSLSATSALFKHLACRNAGRSTLSDHLRLLGRQLPLRRILSSIGRGIAFGAVFAGQFQVVGVVDVDAGFFRGAAHGWTSWEWAITQRWRERRGVRSGDGAERSGGNPAKV